MTEENFNQICLNLALIHYRIAGNCVQKTQHVLHLVSFYS